MNGTKEIISIVTKEINFILHSFRLEILAWNRLFKPNKINPRDNLQKIKFHEWLYSIMAIFS